MKKLLIPLTMLLLINIGITLPSYAQNSEIKVLIDDKEIEFDIPPTIIGGRTMVPVRAIFDNLGIKVSWDNETRTVTGLKGDIVINLQIDNTTAIVNGKSIELDVPATIIDGRTLVPARFIADSIGAQVNWNDETKTVIITTYNKITLGEYITNLIKLLDWNINEEVENKNEISTIERAIEIGKQRGLIIDEDIRYSRFITKEEAELIFIRAMGYDPLTDKITYMENPLDNKGAENSIQQLIIDMYNKIKEPLKELHGFYAIRSYSQRDLISDLDTISYGWSYLEFDEEKNRVELKTEMNNNSSFYLPKGFSEVVEIAKDNNLSINLMVFASQDSNKSEGDIGLVEKIITNPEVTDEVIAQITNKLNGIDHNSEVVSFDGVVIDFEHIKNEELAEDFNTFLKELKFELDKYGKNLYVAVHPRYYYKGYDYKFIGEVADKVILMAHDYHVNEIEQLRNVDLDKEFFEIKNPLTPMENRYNSGFDIYNALKEITAKNTGIEDKDKIMLQISFDSIQLQKDSNGNIEFHNPSYEQIKDRLLNKDTQDSLQIKYDKEFENPYFIYIDTETKMKNIVWYEDTRSVLAKINLAKLLGIKNISIWRLGNIPNFDGENEEFMFLNTWKHIIDQ